MACNVVQDVEVIAVHVRLITAPDHVRPIIVRPSVRVEVDRILIQAEIRVIPDT